MFLEHPDFSYNLKQSMLTAVPKLISLGSTIQSYFNFWQEHKDIESTMVQIIVVTMLVHYGASFYDSKAYVPFWDHSFSWFFYFDTLIL